MMMSSAATAAAMIAAVMVMSAAAAMMMCGKNALQQAFPTPRKDDVMVTDGVLQEIIPGQGGFVELQFDLGAAQVGLGEIPDDPCFGDKCL